jgi:disulfide bond formation protein DsbB
MTHDMLSTRSGDELVPLAANSSRHWTEQLGFLSRYVALLAAWIATCGSLFFSEVLGWVPCELCWYQRILMYPLSIILAVGLLRRDSKLGAYVLPFSLIGAAVSFYHYALQKTDWFPPPACMSGVPCTVDYINLFGFVTIPFLALTAFLIITLSLVMSFLDEYDLDDDADIAEPARRRGFGWDRVAVVVMIAGVLIAFRAAAWLI